MGVWLDGIVVGRVWIVGAWVVMGKCWGVVRAGVRLCGDRWGARFLEGMCVVGERFVVGQIVCQMMVGGGAEGGGS